MIYEAVSSSTTLELMASTTEVVVVGSSVRWCVVVVGSSVRLCVVVVGSSVRWCVVVVGSSVRWCVAIASSAPKSHPQAGCVRSC